MLALLSGAGAIAQNLATTPPPTFCPSSGGCYGTLEEAEAKIQADTSYSGMNSFLEPVETIQGASATQLTRKYRMRNRPGTTFYNAMYFADMGIYGSGRGTCSAMPSDPNTPYSTSWCGDEGALISAAEALLRTKWLNCTLTGSTATGAYSAPTMTGASTTVRGTVLFGTKGMRTEATCADGTTRSFNWTIQKNRTMYCRSLFYATSGAINESTWTTDDLCQPKASNRTAFVIAPVQQCATCKGSPNPVYPATGEKRRQEPDFVFGGRTFTRYYSSIRQFRNNLSFAIGWNHSWDDVLTSETSTAIVYADEEGNYERFVLQSGTRFRGENSVDVVLDKVNQGATVWQMRLPNGEVKEFGANGRLTALRSSANPLADLTFTYDSEGSTQTVTDGQGRVLTFAYVDNLLNSITLPDGRAITYGYDSDLNLTSVVYPDGGVRGYLYNEAGLAGSADHRHHLTGITAEDGRRFASFSYDARGRVIASRVLGTPNELTTVTYPNEDSAVVQTANGDNNSYAIESGVYRRITGMQDGAGTVSREYDVSGHLIRVTDRRNVVTEYQYQNGALAATIEAVGTLSQRRIEVDRLPTNQIAERRILDRNGALLKRDTTTYNARNQETIFTVTDMQTGEARTTTTTYCEADDVTAVDSTCPTLGLIKSVDGPRNDVTDVMTYLYRSADAPNCTADPTHCSYRKGDLWKIQYPNSRTVEVLAYDGAGRMLSAADANGVTIDYEYSPRGWVTATKMRGTDSASETDDRITRMEYNLDGTVRKAIQPDGTFLIFEYDVEQRLTRATDAEGNTLNYTLDSAGNRTREDTKDASGALMRTLSRTYNSLGQLSAATDADNRSTTIGYDAQGNPTSQTDALTRSTASEYDPLGRLTRTLADVGGIAADTRYEYDALGHVVRVTDPKNLNTDYTYNAFGEVLQLRSPDTGTTTYGYDAAGNLAHRVDAANKVIDYRYDAMNRLKMVDYAAAVPDEAYSYDIAFSDCAAGETFVAGRVGRMLDGSGSTTYCYNRFGDLVRKTQRTGLAIVRMRWVYEPSGRLQKAIYPGNVEVDYQYDAQGRIVQIGINRGAGREVLLDSAQYLPFGPAKRLTYGNQRALNRTFDQNYRATAVQDAVAGGIGYGYEYDEVGNLKALHAGNAQGPLLMAYAYDHLNRLTTVRDPSAVVLEQYAYDATGNRQSTGEWVQTSAGGGPGSGTPSYAFQTTNYTYAADSHRLVQVGDKPRLYDAAGNLTQIGADSAPGGVYRRYAYNESGRLSDASAQATLATYSYNGRGERVRRIAYNVETISLYDTSGRWLGDYNQYGQAQQQVVWFGDMPLGVIAGNGSTTKLYYVEADALGTPRAAIDPVRNVAVWRWNLEGETFGKDYPNEDPDGDGLAFNLDMRFPGQRFDAASELTYNYFRDYDARTGRYVESDPIGLLGGVSTYAYADGRPMAQTDNLGLCTNNCSDPPETAPHHLVVISQRPKEMNWLTIKLGWSHPGAVKVTYQVQDRYNNPILGLHWWREGLSRNVEHNSTKEWVPLQGGHNVEDVHDFYGPEEAKKYGIENSMVYVDQWFFVMDEAGCITRLTTLMRTSFQFKNGVQTNHKSIPIIK